jgi:murein L,D-transpeptidase YcbB/YkuD
MPMNKLYLLLLLVFFSSYKSITTSNSFAKGTLFGIDFYGKSAIAIDSMIINKSKDENFKAFYHKYHFETAWNNKEHRHFIIAEIGLAENEGLQPKDYNYVKLKSLEEQFEKLPDSSIVNYDLLLTHSAQLYINHISKGKLNPKDLYRNWDLDQKKIDINKILFDCIDNNNFVAAIEECKPNHQIYKKLKMCLQILKEYPEQPLLGLIDINERIVPNKKNKYLPIIKKRLMYWGDMVEKDTVLSQLYTKKTQDAVKLFQARHGLKPDAIIGRSTIEALNFSRNQRIEQIIANLERWRWFAHDFSSNYLLINIPDYSIVAVKNGDTLLSQRVVVGRETRKTPVLKSKIYNINLNPNWTVPPTILKEDIYPEAEKDKGVFKKKGLVILDDENNEVNPSIWKKEDAYKYKYVQNPSRNNSLGSMKINFPNKYSVYLHDTNHRNLFSFSKRSLSSGCVRLEKPLEMAAYILNDSVKWPLHRIKDTTDINYYIKIQRKKQLEVNKRNAKLLAKNPSLVFEKKELAKPILKTIVIKVKENIFIHQLYWTAWETKGVLNFREDIYCLDTDLYAKLIR